MRVGECLEIQDTFVKAKIGLSVIFPSSQKAFFSFEITTSGGSNKSTLELASELDILDPESPPTMKFIKCARFL